MYLGEGRESAHLTCSYILGIYNTGFYFRCAFTEDDHFLQFLFCYEITYRNLKMLEVRVNCNRSGPQGVQRITVSTCIMHCLRRISLHHKECTFSFSITRNGEEKEVFNETSVKVDF